MEIFLPSAFVAMVVVTNLTHIGCRQGSLKRLAYVFLAQMRMLQKRITTLSLILTFRTKTMLASQLSKRTRRMTVI